jgi:hypothetical protein
MKTACSVLVILGCGALMHAATLAAQSSPAPRQSASGWTVRTGGRDPRDAAYGASGGNEKYHTGGDPSSDRPGHPQVRNKSRVPKAGNLTKPSRTRRPPTSRERSPSGAALNVHQPGRPDEPSRSAAKGALAKNEAIKNFAPTSRSSRAVSHSWPFPNNQRHRGPNPSAIGGLAGASTRNTAAIDGTHLRRKP